MNKRNPFTEEAKAATIATCQKWDRLCAAAPEMAELLREGSSPNDNPLVEQDWKLRVRALLKRIDG